MWRSRREVFCSSRRFRGRERASETGKRGRTEVSLAHLTPSLVDFVLESSDLVEFGYICGDDENVCFSVFRGQPFADLREKVGVNVCYCDFEPKSEKQ